MARDTIFSITGGTAVSIINCLNNNEWIGQVIFGAIIGSIISFAIGRLLSSIFKSKKHE